jgi:hypothetical protein
VKPTGEIYWFNNMAYPGTLRHSEPEAIPSAEWQRRRLDVHRDDPAFIRSAAVDSEPELQFKMDFVVALVSTFSNRSLLTRGPILLLTQE